MRISLRLECALACPQQHLLLRSHGDIVKTREEDFARVIAVNVAGYFQWLGAALTGPYVPSRLYPAGI